MKQKNKRKSKNLGYIIGSVVLGAGMFVVMPKLIEKVSGYVYSKNLRYAKPQNDNDWGPEIVKNSTLEDTKNECNRNI